LIREVEKVWGKGRIRQEGKRRGREFMGEGKSRAGRGKEK
jgi:hypothetical protein